MADSKKYNGSTWEHSLRKLATATDTFTTLPVDVYADGNNATVGISGNTVQNGTPTHDSPIMPQGTGDRTGNLFDVANITHEALGADGSVRYESAMNLSGLIRVDGDYTVSWNAVRRGAYMRVSTYDGNKNFIARIVEQNTYTCSSYSNTHTGYIRINYENTFQLSDIQVNIGSTALPYEPYGYKIPILSAGQTTPVYLGEVETTRKIGKIDLSEVSWTMLASGLWRTLDIPNIKYVSANTELGGGIAEKYTIHTGAGMISALNCIAIDVSQVSVNTGSNTETPTGMFWYVLANEETAVVNEPLMKIGDYADTVSGITIPTITGKDSFDVETTLKPSEASLSYTGWHDATVEEWDGSQWNE